MRPTFLWLILGLILSACVSATPTEPPRLLPAIVHVELSTATAEPPTPTPTDIPPTETATPPPDACALYDSTDPLLRLVDRDNALPRDFAPTDLITLTLPLRNASAQPLRAEQRIEAPLVDMLEATNQAGLTLKVVSVYRSYTEQVLAHQKWAELYPDRANALSAAPGHSEHQLGTAVDFTSPETLARMPNGFHTSFAQTPEGLWLGEHAAEYGFTLSYPDWATSQTGYEWEPWHFRYVGVALAKHLAQQAPPITISQFIQQCASVP